MDAAGLSPAARRSATMRSASGWRPSPNRFRRRRDRLAQDDRPDLRGPPAAELLPLCRPPGLGQDRESPQARLHRRDRGSRTRAVRRHLGQEIPGDRPAPGERLGGIHPFLRLDTEIRRIVCTTNTIESVDARIRRAVKARGHFPNEQAGLRCVYMAIMSLDPTGKGQARWTMHWKTALNASTSPSTAVFPQPASNPNHPGYTVRFTDPRAGAGVQDPLGFCAEVRVADEDPGPVLPGLECVLVQPAAHRGCGDGVGDPARSARRPAQGTTSATAVRRSRRGVGKPASSPRRPVRGRNGRLATLSTPVGRPDVPTKRASGTDESRGQRSNVP